MQSDSPPQNCFWTSVGESKSFQYNFLHDVTFDKGNPLIFKSGINNLLISHYVKMEIEASDIIGAAILRGKSRYSLVHLNHF